jgi:2-hydroxy-6-oxonona-2,4-dienedioate hydrolase
MRRKTWITLALLITVAVLATGLVYTRDMARLRAGLAAGSSLINTHHGPVEVAVWGEGPVVLVLHGAGGGYDQGRLLGQMFGGQGFRFVAVSRFGYLRATLPADPSTRAQAEALADVLDALEVDRAALLAMSGGVPPALQFAALYPERTTALALLSSAPFTPLTVSSQDLPMPAWAYQLLFATDFPVWAISRLAPTTLDPVFDVTPALRARLTPEDAADVQALIAGFLPVTDRIPGLANEGAAIDPAAVYDLASITAPVLIVHTRDDGINPFPIGEYLVAQLPTARFLILPEGGHLLLGHRDEVRAAVAAILRGV